jgi:hypothetical protein
MSESEPHVLLAGVEDDLVARIKTALDPLGLQLRRAPSLAAVRNLPGPTGFDVVIAVFSGDASAPAGLEQLDEWSRSNGRRPGVILLCPGALLGDAANRLGFGIGRLLMVESIESELSDLVSTMLGVAPRFPLRAPVQLAPSDAGEYDTWALGTTENISSSGMLVSCVEELSVGSTIRFLIAVPDHDLTIHGSALVVRTADPVREGFQGVGAQFVSLTGSDENNLNDLLRRRIH